MSAHRPMNQPNQPSRMRSWKVIWSIPIVLIVFAIAFALAYMLTTWVYARIGQAPPPLIASVINSLIGLILMIMLIGTMGWLFGSKQRSIQMGIFGSIVDALGRIAQGDFTVRLDDSGEAYHDREPMGMLVKSVNTLAQELNQMEEMRREFISDVSHEIQSPLTSIRGFARALQDDKLTQAERVHYLNIIETESVRLSKLSDNLLALASLEAENYTVEPVRFRLDNQIRELVLACEPQWQAKVLEMDVEAEPVSICADPDLLRQVWMNLVHNSIKFTPESGKIWIGLKRQETVVEFCIADSGMGISEEDQLHIFERFYKADRARERSRGGSGLGLAIAKRIVEMHHGTIAVESKPDAGSVFTVTLPMAHSDNGIR